MKTLIFILVAIVIIVAVVLVLRSRRASGAVEQTPPAAESAAPQDPFAGATDVSGDPRALNAGDVVEYLGQRFFVRGSLRFREGGYSWSEHFLDDTGGTKRWLSVEEDPDLEVVLWTEHAGDGVTPAEKTLTVDGVEYRRTEHGTAQFRSEGTTGLGGSGRAEYVDYEGSGGRYFAFERFEGGAWEAGQGERVPNGALTVYPAS